MNPCSCIYPRDEFKDTTGCLKETCHNDEHLCLSDEGKYMGWQDDYSCNCGCWDEYEKSGETPCLVYREIGKAEAEPLIFKTN